MGCAHSSPREHHFHREQQQRSSASQRLFRQLFGTTPYDGSDDDFDDDDANDANDDGRRRRRGASSSSRQQGQDREQRQRRDDVMKTKVVLLGDSGVGKSCIVNRFATNTFDIDSRVTVGAAFVARTIEVNDDTRDVGKERKVKFEIWDTAGQERYESLANLYYRRAHVALVVFALDDEKSFEKARFWINELKEKCEKRDALIILCGNKMDKITDEHEDRIVENSSKNNFNRRRKVEKGNDGEIVEGKEEEEEEEEEETIFVSMDRAERMANELGCHMCVTSSAKTGEGVEELFFEVARKLLQREKGGRRKTDATNNEASKQKKTRNTNTSGARANAETAVVPPRTRDEEANNATKKKKKKKKKKTATTTGGESNPSRRPLHDT